MGIVINRQAEFIVRMAKNLETKSVAERAVVLASSPPKVKALVNQALLAFAAKRARSTPHGQPQD